MNHNSNTPKNEDKETRGISIFFFKTWKPDQSGVVDIPALTAEEEEGSYKTHINIFNQTNTFGRSICNSANL